MRMVPSFCGPRIARPSGEKARLLPLKGRTASWRPVATSHSRVAVSLWASKILPSGEKVETQTVSVKPANRVSEPGGGLQRGVALRRVLGTDRAHAQQAHQFGGAACLQQAIRFGGQAQGFGMRQVGLGLLLPAFSH